MFTEIGSFELNSVNKQSDLVPGRYSESQAIYEDESQTVELLLRQFRRGDEKFASVIDCILVYKETYDVFFQDFILLESGAWRSGDGNQSENLLDLLPKNIAELRIVGELYGGDVIDVPGGVA